MKRGTILVNVLIVAAVISIAVFQFGDREPDSQATLHGELIDINNKPVDFTDFKGKVVFVNNWASWCPPCIAEMPSIAELKDKVKNEDIVFVMVSYDEDHDKALSFMQKRGYPLAVYFPGDTYPYETSSIPATFIIDKQGKVVSEHVGMADYGTDEIFNQLRSLSK